MLIEESLHLHVPGESTSSNGNTSRDAHNEPVKSSYTMKTLSRSFIRNHTPGITLESKNLFKILFKRVCLGVGSKVDLRV